MTDDWLDYKAERGHLHTDYRPLLTMYRPPAFIPWIAHRDATGAWVVERHGAWSCVLTLTGPLEASDERQEEHARAVAAALNRVYAPR